ncbi:hypothetical protein TRFO_34118 [Tritrichomonas foetus]|uniref:Integral membrane protein n=1 Tax=Tritrichomonas foetus TaxID=1144522 RepID=A0A1J4JL53_9EUKA|nr:hypothetical protein TRFO_34118 [Tritrichomonas foetus]|eukprot:OHS99401.1 hypothetical protein TRFO_34118 [Tritrichomonas foetus]
MFFLLFGIANAVTMKLCFIFEGEGSEKWGYHKFQKPWWCTLVTFTGMALALPIYLGMCIKDRISGENKLKLVSELSFKDICEFAIPAISDLAEGIVSAVCIVFVGVSINSMMKSGTLVGVSLISRFMFKVHFAAYKWFFIVWVVIALTMVGCSGIISAEDSTTITTGRIWVAVIIILKFITQVGYAIKISYEEYFSQQKGYHPVMICGIEGCWSTAICAFICMPIVQHIPGTEGNGIREDTLDTFVMLGNNSQTLAMSIVIVCLGLVYNCVSTTLIGRTSAVIRTLMEAFRTFLIWIVQFILFYSFSSNDNLYNYRMAGEEWATGSYVQLAGFILMTWALFGYNKLPKYPCFKYISTWKEGDAGIDDNKEDELSQIETETTQGTTDTIENIDLENEQDQALSDVSVRSMSLGSSDESSN